MGQSSSWSAWGSLLPIWAKLSTGGFFSCVLLGKRTADPERSSQTYFTSIDAVWAKEVPLGVSSIHLIPWGVTPKTPHFGSSMGISSINVYARISFQRSNLQKFLWKAKLQPKSRNNRKCCITFQWYEIDENFQQTAYKKPTSWNRLATSEFVCGTT